MILLACVSAGSPWGIGKDNELLIRIPNDMKRFKETTMYNTVICGRKTLESFPNGKPLPYRNHIILSNTYHEDSVMIYPDCPTEFTIKWRNSVESVLNEIKGLPPNQVFLIGGSSVYEQFIPHCHEAYITVVHKTFVGCNKFMENLSQNPNWALLSESAIHTEKSGAIYRFRGYANITKLREDAYANKTILMN